MPGRSHRQRRLSLSHARVVRWVIGLLFAALMIHMIARPDRQGDTRWVIHEAFHELSCISSGKWTGCAGVAAHFPPFQLAPAMALGALGLGEEAILRLFCYFSFICFFASLWLLHRVIARKDRAVAQLGILIYLSGFVLYYSNSSFTEMPASALVLALVASCLRGKSPWLSATLFFAAALSKEIAAPFLLVLAALGLIVRHGGLRPLAARPGALKLVAREFLPLMAAAALAVGTHVAFNFLKFDSPFNQKYLSPEFIVRDLRLQLSFFLGIWLSPASGMIFYWPAFVALFPALGWPLLKHRRGAGRAVTLLGVLAVLAIATLGFSKWFAPFGWIAWGPRLMLPWIPASLLLLLADYAPELRQGLGWIARRPTIARLAAATLALGAFIHFRAMVYRRLAPQILATPGCENAIIENGVAQYFRCTEATTWPWPESWPLLQAYALFPRPDLFALSAIYCACLVWAADRMLKGVRQNTVARKQSA